MTATATEPRAFEYRPHLDGLRTIAVYLVVLFHAGADRFSGGFIGVDLFFVLSGYLVTHVLISDLWSSGTVSLATFYGRRVRRLLPVAVVTLFATAALFTLVASPLETRQAAASFRAAFLYMTNWHFVGASTDYFATDLDTNPVLHFWSLAIEEQFYVVWPVALIGLTALRNRVRRGDLVVRAIVAVLVLASALWALHLSGANVSRAYYGTDTRAYQLLAGALLAMCTPAVVATIGTNARRLPGAVGAAALAVIALLSSSVLDLGPIPRGILATVATLVVLASLERARPEGVVRRVLSTDAATYLGKISYGTYLWHWPVIIVLERTLDIGPLEIAVIATAVATGLAALSSQLLELPIRRSVALARVPRLVAVGGITGGALLGLLLVPPILQGASASGDVALASRTPGDVPQIASGSAAAIDWLAASKDQARAISCRNEPVDACRVVDGPGPGIVVLGDSHAVMMRPVFEEMARRRGYDLYLPGGFGCSWHIGLTRAIDPPTRRQACAEQQDDWFHRIIPEVDPALVVVIQRALDDPDRPMEMVDQRSDGADDDGQEAVLRRSAARTLDRLRALGQRTVVIESIPVTSPEDDPIKCLSTAEVLEACRYVATPGSTPLEGFYAEQVDDEVSVINIDRLVCPYFPICDPVVDGTVVKWDETHLTATYAATISDEIETVLDQAGALP